ncbi:hypothetical protein AMTRI_Chr01g135350 [Amborella trichopoda]
MERSRSKRHYYDQDHETSGPPINGSRRHRHHYHSNHHGHYSQSRPPPHRLPKFSQSQEPNLPVTTCFRILCPDSKTGRVVGKNGSIIKKVSQETDALINVQSLIQGDIERVIEITDVRRRDPDGHVPSYSPAQEALLLIHDRILDDTLEEEDGDQREQVQQYGRGGRVATRLVVLRNHVGCILGRGGKIIEQMRFETRTQIRILPRDQHLPRCVTPDDEIVQIVGEPNDVKKALEIISSRLKESPFRERGTLFHNRAHSPERYFAPDDDFSPHMNNIQRQTPIDGPPLGIRSSTGVTGARNSTYSTRPSSHVMLESFASPTVDRPQSLATEELLFRILCPSDKVESMIGEENGIMEMLRSDVGVSIRVTDVVPGSNERIIIISSEENPEDDLIPAQEALLHIQNHIIDLGPDKDNVVTTRLLVPVDKVVYLEGREGPSLLELKRLTRANIEILPSDELPQCAFGADEVVQIVGDICTARNALVQVTSRLRDALSRESSFSRMPLPPLSGQGPLGNVVGLEPESPTRNNSGREGYQGTGRLAACYQIAQKANAAWSSKDAALFGSRTQEYEESGGHEEVLNRLDRFPKALITRTTVEVLIPENAIAALISRSGSKLAQISEISGASITLLDSTPGMPDRKVEISGAPEQAERAQSLLQGFVLSTQEDVPVS